MPCPSARRPDQNRHRIADGWQGSTVRAILENPRYTGYAFFGRWAKHETLLDPDDVAAGHVVRFRRATPDRIVRSRTPAHPELISVEDFTRVQLLRRSKGGLKTACKTKRSGRRTTRTYLFRGRIRCTVCGRKMEASPRAHGMYYRCPARTLAPGSSALAHHPPAVYLREDAIRDGVNGWLGRLFHRDNVDRTVSALVASQDGGHSANRSQESAKRRVAEAEKELERYQAAIAAGIDPAALVEPMNQAQAKLTTAQAELNNQQAPNALTEAEVYAMVDSLGDVGAALSDAKPDSLAGLYTAVGLQVRYEPEAHVADVAIQPAGRVNSACVRGGSGPRTPR
ncbi:MAG: hypothetical protein GEU97_19545 [Actinophytocola sp.]|nr:hypothetical protein [Actinophytocola sp.]